MRLRRKLKGELDVKKNSCCGIPLRPCFLFSCSRYVQLVCMWIRVTMTLVCVAWQSPVER
jgi:hypothetical protein